VDQYPIIKLIVEHGQVLAFAIGVLPFFGGIGLVALGVHWTAAVVGIVGSGVLYFLMRSYVELVRVIADMLLPK
jgi:hypothetical protein